MDLAESTFRRNGYQHILGIDEAGRGPLAGPVVASAVCLPEISFTHPIRDSKLLTPRQREAAFLEIMEKSVVGVGVMSEAVIDQVNILNATFLAMRNAINSAYLRLEKIQAPGTVTVENVFLLVDGNRFSADVPYAYQTIVGGDNRVLSIAAASIVAKVVRDRMLMSYDQVYPQYGFRKHKGYPTREHKKAILDHGLTAIHRRSYVCQ